MDIVLVHDGARPLAKPELFKSVIEGAKTHGAVTIGVPSTDTIKRVDIDGQVLETLNRNELMNIQTPQGFLKKYTSKKLRKRLSVMLIWGRTTCP